jgi:hypothetical protein
MIERTISEIRESVNEFGDICRYDVILGSHELSQLVEQFRCQVLLRKSCKNVSAFVKRKSST